MKIQIKIINDDYPMNLHIFENYSIEAIKFVLKENPKLLIEQIEKMEKLLSPPEPGDRRDNNWEPDRNVYI
jgi:hypothetical protein